MQGQTTERYGKITEQSGESLFKRFIHSIVSGCLTCGCLTVLFFAALLAAGIYLFSSDSSPVAKCGSLMQNDEPEDFTETCISGGNIKNDRIAVIDVNGLITSDENASLRTCAVAKNICKKLQQAANDKTVKGIIINLNTPGGEVTASDEIYRKILLVRKKKPVTAMMNSMCASGGYYIAAACSPVITNKYTLTGSIGVIISTWNYKGLFDKIGVKSEVYTSGKMKDMLNGGRDRTAEEEALVKQLVNNAYDGFVQVVSSSRKIPAEKIRTTLIGDGRIFDGKQALELKLADRIGYFEDAVEACAKEAKLKEYQVFRYEEKFDFGKIFDFLSAEAPAVRLVFPEGTARGSFEIKKGVLYFLPAGY